MTTITDIRDNGTIEEVKECLKRYPLARRLEFADMPPEMNFICTQHIGVGQSFMTDKGRCYKASETQDYKDLTVFSGNFFTWSYTFTIATDDPQLIRELTAMILDNIQRPDYLAQDKPDSTMGDHYILFPDGSELVWNYGVYK